MTDLGGLPDFFELPNSIQMSDFELLRVVEAFCADGYTPTFRDIANEFGVSRARIGIRVKRLRKYGMVEENESGRRWGIYLTPSAKLLLEVGLAAGVSA